LRLMKKTAYYNMSHDDKYSRYAVDQQDKMKYMCFQSESRPSISHQQPQMLMVVIGDR